MLNSQAQATWKSFFAVAEAFQELAPWQWMEDRHIFRVHHEQQGQDYYCSILGNGGEVFGINLYPGEAGLASLLALYEGVSEESEMPPLAIYEQFCFRLDFTELEYFSEDDRAVYTLLERPIDSGRDQLYISLQLSRPGLVPIQPALEDVAIVTDVIKSALEVAKNYQNNVAALNQLIDLNTVPAYQLAANGKSVIEYVTMPEVELRWSPEELPELSLRSIKKLPVQEKIDVLIVMHLPGQIVQESPEEDAYFPLTIFWVRAEDGSITSFDLLHPEILKKDLRHLVAKKFTEQGVRPNQLAINDVLVAKAVQPLCEQLDIALLIAPTELTNEIFMTMMQVSGQMEQGGLDGLFE